VAVLVTVENKLKQRMTN